MKFVQITADLKLQKKEESSPINCELLSKSTMRVTQTEHQVAILSPVSIFLKLTGVFDTTFERVGVCVSDFPIRERDPDIFGHTVHWLPLHIVFIFPLHILYP